MPSRAKNAVHGNWLLTIFSAGWHRTVGCGELECSREERTPALADVRRRHAAAKQEEADLVPSDLPCICRCGSTDDLAWRIPRRLAQRVVLRFRRSYLQRSIGPRSFVSSNLQRGFCSLHAVPPTPLVSWKEASAFRVALVPPKRTKMVVYDRASTTPQQTARRINEFLVGADEGLPDTYGMKPQDLADFLNASQMRATRD